MATAVLRSVCASTFASIYTGKVFYMKPPRKTLLLYVRSIGEYTDFLTTARLLAGDYHILIVNENSVELQGQGYLNEKARAIGCDCYDIRKEILKLSRTKIFLILLKHFRHTVPLTLYAILSNLLRLRFNGIRVVLQSMYIILVKEKLRNILIKYRPCALLINNVNGGTLGEMAIVCAREQGIKSILIPYTFISPIAPARVFMEKNETIIRGGKLRFAKKYCPQWIYEYEGKHILRKSLHFILTLRILKAEPPLPWIQDSSTADVMAIESDFMKAHYDKLGIAHPDLRVIGKPNHDYLYSLYMQKDSLTLELYEELQFAQKKPFLLLAIPPRFIDFKEREGRDSEFQDYDEIVAFLLDTVSGLKSYNILVCLHPRERARLHEPIFRQNSLPGHVRYSTRDTAELMSVSELYIMAGSSTALWALALKHPVIDYDVYAFNFDFFKGNPDVMLALKKSEFLKLIKKVDSDPTFLEIRKAILHDKGDFYGRLDGQSVERLKQVIEELSAPA